MTGEFTFFCSLLLVLCAGHALSDYPLQGDFLAKGKNHKAPFPGYPAWQMLLAHCLIHAGMVHLVVWLFTASMPLALFLAVCELLIHSVTDYAKCDGRISFNQDQAIHYACKLLWVIVAFFEQPR